METYSVFRQTMHDSGDNLINYWLHCSDANVEDDDDDARSGTAKMIRRLSESTKQIVSLFRVFQFSYQIYHYQK